MDRRAERRCHLPFGSSLGLLTTGIGCCVIAKTCFADFLVVIAGLALGWVAILYCLGQSIIGE